MEGHGAGDGDGSPEWSVAQLMQQAEAAMERCAPNLATQFYARALEQQPNNGHLLTVYADALCADGQFDVARLMLQRAIKVEPDTGAPKYLAFAQFLHDQEAVACFSRGIDLLLAEEVNPGTEEAEERSQLLCSSFCAIAELYMTDLCEEPDAEAKCEAALTKALEHVPTSPEALQTMASLRISQCKPEEAWAFLQKACAWLKGPDDDYPAYAHRINTVKLLCELEHWKEADQVVETLLGEDDETPEVWYLAAMCRYEDLDEVEACLDNAMSTLGHVQYDDAEVLEAQIRQALERVQQAKEAAPKDSNEKGK